MTLKSARTQDRTTTLAVQTFETQSEAAAFLAISPRTLSRRLETAEFEMGERLKLEMLGEVRDLALKPSRAKTQPTVGSKLRAPPSATRHRCNCWTRCRVTSA
jgi:hypothetical protein